MEIYQPETGWTPIEMTPASGQAYTSSDLLGNQKDAGSTDSGEHQLNAATEEDTEEALQSETSSQSNQSDKRAEEKSAVSGSLLQIWYLVPVLTSEAIQHMMRTVNRATYRDRIPTEKENAFLRSICQRTIRFFYSSASLYRKILLRFWYAFL
nr:hypothetical protein [uncultured Sellimonas sp.]